MGFIQTAIKAVADFAGVARFAGTSTVDIDPLIGECVLTRASVPISAPVARDTINMLRNLTDTNNARRELLSLLHNLGSGEEIPPEYTTYTDFFDDHVPNHTFFEGETMGVLEKTFFEDILSVNGRGEIVLDSSYYDIQIKRLAGPNPNGIPMETLYAELQK